MNCIFCKIIKGEVPATKVYEDENVLAFLDIKPVNPGHTLVIPKEHSENFLYLELKQLNAMIGAVQKVAKAIGRATGCEGFNLGLNNGKVAGQEVPHVHMHVMPRHSGDGHELMHGKPYESGQIDAVANKIKEAI